MQTLPLLTDPAALTRRRARAVTEGLFLQDLARADVQDRLNEVNRTFTKPVVVTGFPQAWQGWPIVAEAETLALTPGAHDLIIHAMGLHWANDPVGQLVQCRRALQPDGLLIAPMFGGQTLHQLRAVLAEAETEVTGGLSPRVLPMAEIRDLGGLLQRAGLALPVADAFTTDVRFRDLFHLMTDLRAMGEANALAARLRRPTRSAVFRRAAEIYARTYAAADGRIVATFEIIVLTGWAPDPGQQQPLRPGSAAQRLADALGAADSRPMGRIPVDLDQRRDMSRVMKETAMPHLPADHPAVKSPRIGVLLANLGTPDGYDYWSMRRYLGEFLSDKRVVDMPDWKWQPILQGIILSVRPSKSGANYRKIWNHEQGESPLLTITKAQTAAIAAAMSARHGDRVLVDFCMRYGNPSTASKVRAMVAAGCEKILFFPLYPHYAGATSATANDAFFRALTAEKRQPASRTVAEYFEQPAYIAALAGSVRRAWDLAAIKPQKLVASYHGMPIRYLMQGDPYHCQCQKTTRLLREALGWESSAIDTSFQSVFGREEWLKPYTVKHVAELARQGIKSIAVIAPAFSADCIETLEEIEGEIRESFLHAGGESFTYIPCLNDQPEHIAALSQVIEENLSGWLKPS